MGKLPRGFLGGFQGQLGTAYGCFWRSKDLIKAMPRKVKRTPSPAQADTRLIFGVVMAFLTPIKMLIASCYHTSNPSLSPLNAAASYHLKNAIIGTSPNYRIDPSKVEFSKGDLEEPKNPGVEASGLAKIAFDWAPLSDPELGEATDKATIMVYNPTLKKYTVLRNAVARTTLLCTLQLPGNWIGHDVHCYMAFVSETGKKSSNSVFFGTITVI